MKIVTTQELLILLAEAPTKGIQVSVRSGILNSTKCLFKRENLIYYFGISDNFDFRKSNGLKESTFLKKYKNQYWIFEMEL